MIKYQFNKTSLTELGRQLKIRTNALPTIKSKESALRLEVKHAKQEAQNQDNELKRLLDSYSYMSALWSEFDPSLISVKDVELSEQKIAGVIVPVLKSVQYEESYVNLFTSPTWWADGKKILKGLAETGIRREVFLRRAELLEKARKRTTQKVNLYEKVQIPGYEEAILKIKRFLEDEDNLSKSSQKIFKARLEKETEAEQVERK